MINSKSLTPSAMKVGVFVAALKTITTLAQTVVFKLVANLSQFKLVKKIHG